MTTASADCSSNRKPWEWCAAVTTETLHRLPFALLLNLACGTPTPSWTARFIRTEGVPDRRACSTMEGDRTTVPHGGGVGLWFDSRPYASLMTAQTDMKQLGDNRHNKTLPYDVVRGGRISSWASKQTARGLSDSHRTQAHRWPTVSGQAPPSHRKPSRLLEEKAQALSCVEVISLGEHADGSSTPCPSWAGGLWRDAAGDDDSVAAANACVPRFF